MSARQTAARTEIGKVTGLAFPGRGPRVLLLHGAGLNAAAWVPAAQHLTDFDCLALDLPGHGWADSVAEWDLQRIARAFLELVKPTEQSPVALVGHSLGAAVASLIAASTAKREVSALVNLDGWGCFNLPVPEEAHAAKTLLSYATALDEVRGPRSEILNQEIESAARDGLRAANVRPLLERQFRSIGRTGVRHRPNSTDFIGAVTCVDDWDMQGLYRDLRLPVLLVAAAHLRPSPGIPDSAVLRYSRARSVLQQTLVRANPRISTLTKAWAHDFPVRHPSATASMLRAYLTEHVSSVLVSVTQSRDNSSAEATNLDRDTRHDNRHHD